MRVDVDVEVELPLPLPLPPPPDGDCRGEGSSEGLFVGFGVGVADGLGPELRWSPMGLTGSPKLFPAIANAVTESAAATTNARTAHNATRTGERMPAP